MAERPPIPYIVRGAHRETGDDVEFIIYANTPSEAEGKALAMGVLIKHIDIQRSKPRPKRAKNKSGFDFFEAMLPLQMQADRHIRLDEQGAFDDDDGEDGPPRVLIEKTSKEIKKRMLMSAVVAVGGLLAIFTYPEFTEIGVLALIGGAGAFIVFKFQAWWEHG